MDRKMEKTKEEIAEIETQYSKDSIDLNDAIIKFSEKYRDNIHGFTLLKTNNSSWSIHPVMHGKMFR